MKNINCEQGGKVSTDKRRTQTILLCLSFVSLGFIGGYHIKDLQQCSEQLCSSPFTAQQGVNVLDISSRRKLRVEMFDKFDSLASNAFSCNNRAAYDELTTLYARRIELEKHRARGEANRDRIAVISRKTGQAESAERAFRSCVAKMVPELLKMWDEDLTKNQLRIREKLINNKYDKDGVSLADLEETADMLDSIQNP